mgnify:CR=1 FL=1
MTNNPEASRQKMMKVRLKRVNHLSIKWADQVWNLNKVPDGNKNFVLVYAYFIGTSILVQSAQAVNPYNNKTGKYRNCFSNKKEKTAVLIISIEAENDHTIGENPNTYSLTKCKLKIFWEGKVVDILLKYIFSSDSWKWSCISNFFHLLTRYTGFIYYRLRIYEK